MVDEHTSKNNCLKRGCGQKLGSPGNVNFFRDARKNASGQQKASIPQNKNISLKRGWGKKLGSPGNVNFFGYTTKKANGRQTHTK